jgi:hypothetical protein
VIESRSECGKPGQANNGTPPGVQILLNDLFDRRTRRPFDV